ncbi:MAG: phosphoadenosine phosphosulfate reductase family protein [Nitrosopumilus sp.]|nr:phosphoadenosine phosphosulfate reductase family protein [Nitrosopumilus sp.]
MKLEKNIPIQISFSGGRSSAFMVVFALNYETWNHHEKIILFANTGKENEQTLEFIDRCSKHFNFKTVWVEAVVNSEKGVGTTHKIVDFKSASRNGEPFEDMLKKYGIPNNNYPHCTRELKQQPMKSYMNSLGYKKYYSMRGIRADEKHRLSRSEVYGIPVYPLAEHLTLNEKMVREFWDRQPFDLELKDYEGNCDLCWKKSLRKKMTLISENQKIAEWWRRTEKENGYSGGRPMDKVALYEQRHGMSIEQIIEKSKEPFVKIADKHIADKQFDLKLDYEESCFCKSN